jgi:hypothetical protein
VGVRLDVCQLVRTRRFGLDAGDGFHGGEAFYEIVEIGAMPGF